MTCRYATVPALAIVLLAGACFTPGKSSQGATETDTATGGTQSGTTASVTTTVGDVTTQTSTSGPTTGVTTTLSTTTATTSTGTGGGSSTGTVPLPCVEGIIDPATGNGLVMVDTNTTGSDFMGTCGGLDSKDAAYEWIAPFSDFFVFDTQGSDFDTVLYLLDGACDGPELACNNDVEGSVYSQVVARFDEGDKVVVVIDGSAGEAGNAVLDINQVDCPNADLDGQALPLMTTNVAGTNMFGSACGGDGSPERTFRYTAQEAGLYAFRMLSSAFAPVMSAQAGPICGGQDLQCNAGGGGGVIPGEVIRNLGAGQSMTLVADSAGGSGNFSIDVVNLGLTCPEGDLSSNSASGDITTFEHVMSTSCGPAGDAFSGMVTYYGAATYTWTSPGMSGTSSGCDITVTSGFPAALSLQEGSCDGPEVQCVNSTVANNQYTATVSVGNIPATAFTVTVTPVQPSYSGWFDNQFDIQVSCYAIG